MALRATVVAALAHHGLSAGALDTPASLHERLNDLYLEEVRRLRQRQRDGEIPLRDYARQAEELKRAFPLLGLPLHMWEE